MALGSLRGKNKGEKEFLSPKLRGKQLEEFQRVLEEKVAKIEDNSITLSVIANDYSREVHKQITSLKGLETQVIKDRKAFLQKRFTFQISKNKTFSLTAEQWLNAEHLDKCPEVAKDFNFGSFISQIRYAYNKHITGDYYLKKQSKKDIMNVYAEAVGTLNELSNSLKGDSQALLNIAKTQNELFHYDKRMYDSGAYDNLMKNVKGNDEVFEDIDEGLDSTLKEMKEISFER